MTECAACGWAGEDCEIVSCSEGELYLCMACRLCLVVTDAAKTVGKMTPVMLVPLIRACVSQSVGAIVAQVLQQLSESSDYDQIIQSLKSGGMASDPN
jgi:hypothetical protein